MKPSKTTGAALAMAAAGLFTMAPMVASADSGMEGEVKCYGVNSCKGKNDCKSLFNSCKGQSSCKGKGFLKMSSEKECTDKGGKLKQEESKEM